MPFTYEYPRPAVTADVVVLAPRSEGLSVLLVKRGGEPFRGAWALPGGYVNPNERLERAALRELSEETGLTGVRLEELGAFGDPGRDPRGHTVTIAYYTYILADRFLLAPGDDAVEVGWHRVKDVVEGAVSASAALPPHPPSSRPMKKGTRASLARTRARSKSVTLAFDHAQIVARAVANLRAHLDVPLAPKAFEVVPARFTLAELRRTYELVFERKLAPRSFRERALASGLLAPTTERRAGERAARDQLYSFRYAQAL